METSLKKQGENGGTPLRGQSRGKLASVQAPQETIDKILSYYTSDYSFHQIANEVGVSYATVSKYFNRYYSKDDLKVRQKRTRSVVQYELCLMCNKRREAHHNWKGYYEKPTGHRNTVPPEWYKTKARRVPLHDVIYAEHHLMTHIPKGYVVHHIDCNPRNNDISNLQLMTRANHAAYHKVNPC